MTRRTDASYDLGGGATPSQWSHSTPAGVFAVLAAACMLANCAPSGRHNEELSLAEGVYYPPLGASGIGVAYGRLTSVRDDAVIAISSPRAERIELHRTVRDGAMSRMEQVEQLDLMARQPVTLEPGGLHIMVISPTRLLAGESKDGAAIPITFQLRSGLIQTLHFEQAAR